VKFQTRRINYLHLPGGFPRDAEAEPECELRRCPIRVISSQIGNLETCSGRRRISTDRESPKLIPIAPAVKRGRRNVSNTDNASAPREPRNPSFARPMASCKLSGPPSIWVERNSSIPSRLKTAHAVESLRRDWEMRLHRNAQRHKGNLDYRLRAIPTFDAVTQFATVRFDIDPMPPYIVRRIEFRGNQRFPDRYLRQRIGLSEGQSLDEYTLEAGLARLARTGYFEPFEKEDVQIETHEAGHIADVTIHLHEKGKQRVAFSGGRPGATSDNIGPPFLAELNFCRREALTSVGPNV
jgi:hypothetical protein